MRRPSALSPDTGWCTNNRISQHDLRIDFDADLIRRAFG
jgi:hypothetical protein